MPRTLTVAQADALKSDTRKEFHRWFIQNPDGVMTDITTLAGKNWFKGGEIDAFDLDQPIAQATIRLQRDHGALSLSPLRDDSTLNRNAAAAYAPFLDASRAIYGEVAIIDPTVAAVPAAGDWQRIFQGTIDDVDPASDNDTEVLIVARDLGARLQDAWLEEPTALVVAGGFPMTLEVAIQTMLDTALGVGQVPLFAPVPMGYMVTRFGYQREPLFDAIQRLAQSASADCRYLWDAGTSSFRLTVYRPPRTKVVPDFTFGPKGASRYRYKTIKKFRIGRSTVRNRVKVFFTDASGIRDSIVVNDAASQLRYGVRPLIIEEAGDSPVNTLVESTDFANSLLADLKAPKADKEMEMPLHWGLEGNDLLRFSSNGVHYNSNQDLAIRSLRHSLRLEGMSQSYPILRGSPAGAYSAWIKRGGPPVGGGPEVQPPRVFVSPDGDIKSTEFVLVTGGPGKGAPTSPFQMRQRQTVNGVVSAWSAYAPVIFPASASITRDNFYSKETEFEVLQADGQTASRVWHSKSRLDAAQAAGLGRQGTTEDDARSGAGGMPTHGGRIQTDPIYTRDGGTPLIDTDLWRLTDSLGAADGLGSPESGYMGKRRSVRSSGHATGRDGEDLARAGTGGVATPGARIHTEPMYDVSGATPLIDPVTRQILAGLGIGTGVRGAADVAFGGTVKYAPNRHTEQKTGKDADVLTYGVSFDLSPKINLTPLKYTAPTAGNVVEFSATGGVGSCTLRCVQTSGSTPTARTDSFATALNGAPAGGILIQGNGSAAYCNIVNADGTAITFKVNFDFDSTNVDPANTVYVQVYTNRGTADNTNWDLVASASYGAGIVATGQYLQFTAPSSGIGQMLANYDVRVVITYQTFPLSPQRAQLTCNTVTYTTITGGTTTSLASFTGAAVQVQSMEAA